MCYEPEHRLGRNGSAEVKAHPFLASVDWQNLLAHDAAFVPRVTDPESTDYFDLRGATHQDFDDEDAVPVNEKVSPIRRKQASLPAASASLRGPRSKQPSPPLPPPAIPAMPLDSPAADDFGTFNFKNLEVLSQANQEVIKKLRSEQSQPLSGLWDSQGPVLPSAHPRALQLRSTSTSMDSKVRSHAFVIRFCLTCIHTNSRLGLRHWTRQQAASLQLLRRLLGARC